MSGDFKVELLESKYGLKGYAIYNKILEKKFSDESFSLADDLMIQTMAKKWDIKPEFLKEVVSYMIEPCKLFQNFSCESEAIEDRKNKIDARRKSDRSRKNANSNKYIEDNSEKNEFSDGKPAENIRKTELSPLKEKESKEKESKENNTHTEEGVRDSLYSFNILVQDEFYEVALKNLRNPPNNLAGEKEKQAYQKLQQQFVEQAIDGWNVFAQKNGLSEIKSETAKRRASILARFRDKNFDIVKIYEKISSSDFLRGLIPGKTWKANFDWVFISPYNYIKILEGTYNHNGIAKITNGKASSESDRIREQSEQLTKVIKTVVACNE